MIQLRVFGTLRLDGDEATAAARSELAAQPKTMALLLYLALARPRGLQQRDRVIGLLWPDSDQERARGALRKTLQRLRAALGEDAVRSHGTEALSLDDEAVWCDAIAFASALERGRLREALDLYTPELLPAFFVPGSGEFERWLDGERAHYRERAARAAWQLVELYTAAEDYTNAAQLARFVARFAENDERMLRRVLTMLAHVGDRAGAMGVYRQFSERLWKEFETRPSPETVRLVEAIQRGDALS